MTSTMHPIETFTPVRAANQRDVLSLTLPPLRLLRVAFIGVGARGRQAVMRWCHIPGVEIVAVCDSVKSTAEEVSRQVAQLGKPRPAVFSGESAYIELCQLPAVNLIYVCTDWLSHAPIAIHAMQNRKNVAVEVPAALSLKDIWQLIDTAERTQQHCMMLENTVYDDFEMAVEKMAKLLNMHKTDRMHYLTSMQTDAFIGTQIYQKVMQTPCSFFANGDQTSTTIRTLKGKTILIQHNVMSPRPYNRMFQVIGTQGYAAKYPTPEIMLSRESAAKVGIDIDENSVLLSASQIETLLHSYAPDFRPKTINLAKQLDPRGGMSYFMDLRLAHCLQQGLPLDMDVYDLAEWCSIAELSKLSIEHGSMPVLIPDFTRGAGFVR